MLAKITRLSREVSGDMEDRAETGNQVSGALHAVVRGLNMSKYSRLTTAKVVTVRSGRRSIKVGRML